MPKNRRRATINDVAVLSGVSTATVSRVLNNPSLVNPDTRRKVLSAVAELKYRPDAAARTLASKKTNTIGLIFTEISGDFFSQLLRGIEKIAQAHDYNLMVYSTGLNPSFDFLSPPPLGDHNTDGLIVFVNCLPDHEIIRLYDENFPLVLLHQSPPKGIHIPFITVENVEGARKIIDHLIEEHGYRRIAYLAGNEDQEDSAQREVGYRESLMAHGIEFDPTLIAVGGFEREKARQAVETWLAQKLSIDAIFAGDDEAAFGVFTALDQAGLAVPEDIAVVGFDDLAFSPYLRSPLTTIHSPIEEVGHRSVELLLQLIEGKDVEEKTILPTYLVIRQSCGCEWPVEKRDLVVSNPIKTKEAVSSEDQNYD